MNRNKHGASILIRMEVFELLDTGEYSGVPLKADELEKFGLKPSMKVSIKGDTKELLLKNLKERIDEFSK